MHHVLAFAKMIISDSQTMTVESAVLGVPSIRINSFFDRCSILDELENKYELTFAFHPDQKEQILKKTSDILIDENSDYLWDQRRKRLLKNKVDFNKWLIDFSESELLGHA
jgi:predicted glycosyltransferase